VIKVNPETTPVRITISRHRPELGSARFGILRRK
jgi:hypothetical protein